VRSFRASEVIIAAASTIGSQFALYLALSWSPSRPKRAEISDESLRRPLTVSITPVTALPGGKSRAALPSAWQPPPAQPAAHATPLPPPAGSIARAPSLSPVPDATVVADSRPVDAQVPAESKTLVDSQPQDERKAEAASRRPPGRSVPDSAIAAATPNPLDAAPIEREVLPLLHRTMIATRAGHEPKPRPSPAGPAPLAPRAMTIPLPVAPSTPGTGNSGEGGNTGAAEPAAPDGGAGEGESDGLKMRAIGLYRAQLAAWFLVRFHIRGKIPFAILKGLHTIAIVSIAPDHTMSGYRLVSESGNPIFDAQVRATLDRIQSGGASLPAPPPWYPDLLGSSLSVSFKCTVRSECE
jgi:hypothetical protein